MFSRMPEEGTNNTLTATASDVAILRVSIRRNS